MIYKTEEITNTQIPIKLLLEERVIEKYRRKKRIRATLEDSLKRFEQYKYYLEESFDNYLDKMCEISRIDLTTLIGRIRVLVVGRKDERTNDLLGVAYTKNNDLSDIKVMVSPEDKHLALTVLFHEIFHFVLDIRGKSLSQEQKDMNHQVIMFLTNYKLSVSIIGKPIKEPIDRFFTRLDEAYGFCSLNAIEFRDQLLKLTPSVSRPRTRRIPKDKRKELLGRTKFGKRRP